MECTSIFSPVEPTCNRWLPDKRRFCMHPAGRHDERQYAERLRLAIVNGKHQVSADLDAMLTDLAVMVHCRNPHRKIPQQITATVRYWTAELDLSNRSSEDRAARNAEQALYQEQLTLSTLFWTCSRQLETLNATLQRLQIPPSTATATRTQVADGTRNVESRPTPLPYTSVATRSQTANRINVESQPAPPSYIPPVTRSQTANGTRVIASRPILPRFELRRGSGEDAHEAIAGLVGKPFGQLEHQEGYIYMFTRESDPGYVKIGWSTDVARRMREWERHCHYKPILVYQSPLISHAFRAEQLIFTQLAKWRCDDMRCINDDICQSRHKEWFKLRQRDALRVIEMWVDWVRSSPYHEYGRLKDSWKRYLDRWLEVHHSNLIESDVDLHFGRELPNSIVEAEARNNTNSEAHNGTDNDHENASPHSGEGGHDSRRSLSDECAICYDDLGPPTERKLPACTLCRNGPWHDECIRKWIESSPLCPMCRGRHTIDIYAGDGR